MMREHFRVMAALPALSVVLLAALIFLVPLPVPVAYAQPVAQTGTEPAPATSTAEAAINSCRNYGVLVGAIVPCVINIISQNGVALAESFRALILPIFYAFLTLVIIFFGVKLSQGAQSVGKDSLLLMLKIAFVIGFINLLPSLIPSVAAVLRDMVGVIANVLADPADFHCDVARYLKPGGDLLWAQADCVLGKIYGYTMQSSGSNEPNMLLAASAFGAIGGFLFSGATGVFIFIATISMLISLFTMVIRMVGSYINAFILITLLIIIAPIFLPLSLLQQTMTYFDKWWRAILAAMLLPVLVSTYFVIAMLIYDTLLFKPDSIVKKLFDADFMKQIQVENQESCGPAIVQSQAFSQASGTITNNAARLIDPNVFNRIRPTLSGNNLNCISHAAMRINPQEAEKLFIQLMQLLIIAYILQKGFDMMRTLVTNFGSQMVSATMDPVSSQEKTLSDAIENLRQGVLAAPAGNGGNFAQASGTDFIRAIPGALTSGVQGFMGTFNDGRLR